MAKEKKKYRTAIYHPPKAGMPYLVVTVSPEGVTATACESKDEARILASSKAMKVSVEDAHPEILRPKAATGSPLSVQHQSLNQRCNT